METRQIIGINFVDFFQYSAGSDTIYHYRTKNVYGGPKVYENWIRLDSAKEAAEYFETNCGA